MTDDSFFNISKIKLLITSLFSVQIMSHFGVSDIIYSDVVDSFISEILKYVSLVMVSSTEKPWALHYTTSCYRFIVQLGLVFLQSSTESDWTYLYTKENL